MGNEQNRGTKGSVSPYVITTPERTELLDFNLSTLVDGTRLFQFYNFSTFKASGEQIGALQNGSYMFYGCPNLKEAVLSNCPTVTIATGMFAGCSNITHAALGTPNLISAESLFEGIVLGSWAQIPGRNLLNCDRALRGDVKLERAVINAPKLLSGKELFSGCRSVTDVTLTSSKLLYGDRMFYGCASLKTLPEDVVFPSLKSGKDMFTGCSSLSTASIVRVLQSLPDHSADTKNKHIITVPDRAGSVMADAVTTAQNRGWIVRCE